MYEEKIDLYSEALLDFEEKKDMEVEERSKNLEEKRHKLEVENIKRLVVVEENTAIKSARGNFREWKNITYVDVFVIFSIVTWN